MPRNKKSPVDSLERKVIETPTLSRLDVGIVNEGFDSIPSPSFFYIDDSSSWSHRDHRRGGDQKRFTESWIELDRAYSCGSSSIDRRRCCSRRGLSRCIVYLLVAFSVIGFAAIVSAILYMEILHKMDYYEWHPLKAKVFDERITHLHRANTTYANENLHQTTSSPPPDATASTANDSLPVFASSPLPSPPHPPHPPPAIPLPVVTAVTRVTATPAPAVSTPSPAPSPTAPPSLPDGKTTSRPAPSSPSSSNDETTSHAAESTAATVRISN